MKEIKTIEALLAGNAYPGRGIIIGKSADGSKACTAYFIMGRSENSRNRVFRLENGKLKTAPFDPSKVEDPRLIIYNAVCEHGKHLIVTNGDQTDTIDQALEQGIGFAEALESRCFEPDAPHFTPRISGILDFKEHDFSYQLSILKSADAAGSACVRELFSYPAVAGVGHLLHTYACDGNPLPSFEGEPKALCVENDIDSFANSLWAALNSENKISLYVRFTDLHSGEKQERIINKKESA